MIWNRNVSKIYVVGIDPPYFFHSIDTISCIFVAGGCKMNGNLCFRPNSLLIKMYHINTFSMYNPIRTQLLCNSTVGHIIKEKWTKPVIRVYVVPIKVSSLIHSLIAVSLSYRSSLSCRPWKERTLWYSPTYAEIEMPARAQGKCVKYANGWTEPHYAYDASLYN